MGGSGGSWPADIGNNMEARFATSLLDEFKNKKTRPFELSDIVDHVVQFRYQSCTPNVFFFLVT